MNLQQLPEDIENEIKEYVFTKSMRLHMLLEKYPLSNFFNDFTKEQLDRIYRYGCISKVLKCDRDAYSWNYVQPIVTELLQNDNRVYTLFTYNCWPVAQFNAYWQLKRKTLQPSKKEYIHRITTFCNFVLQHTQTPNEKFTCFCEKLVYDVVVGSLIMRNS